MCSWPEFLVRLCPPVYLRVSLCHASNGDAYEMWCFDRFERDTRSIDSPRLHFCPPFGGLFCWHVRRCQRVPIGAISVFLERAYVLLDSPFVALLGAIRCQPVANRWTPFRQGKHQARHQAFRVALWIPATRSAIRQRRAQPNVQPVPANRWRDRLVEGIHSELRLHAESVADILDRRVSARRVRVFTTD